MIGEGNQTRRESLKNPNQKTEGGWATKHRRKRKGRTKGQHTSERGEEVGQKF